MGTDVKFTAKLDAAGALVWEVGGKPAKNHQTKVEKFAKPEKIDFVIESDSSVDDLELRIDCSKPFEVTVDDGNCPPNGAPTDQIEVLSCHSDRVTVRDLNTGPEQTLRYQINVVDKDGHAHPCDPIILNGGAGPGNLI